MKIGEEIIVGRMGQQPMHIADASVDPQHAVLRHPEHGVYQIEDIGSAKGIFVFGMRIKRKTVKAETPILLGTFKTSVQQLLQDVSQVNLEKIWNEYDAEKRKWDRYSTMTNSIRFLSPFVLAFLTQKLGQNLMLSFGVLAFFLLVSMLAGEIVLNKKNLRMTELNAEMQRKYVCPHCRKYLGPTPYRILKKHIYCPNPVCSCPLP